MNDLLFVSQMTCFMMCYYQNYLQMLPLHHTFRPFGYTGYYGAPIHGSKQIDPRNWMVDHELHLPILSLIFRKVKTHLPRKYESATIHELLDFLSVRLNRCDEIEIEFTVDGQWHIIEVDKESGCYAIDGENYEAMNLFFSALNGIYSEVDELHLTSYSDDRIPDLLVQTSILMRNAISWFVAHLEYFAIN